MVTAEAKLSPKSRWIGCDADQRQGWLGDFFVAHPAVNRILSDLNEKLDESARSGSASGMFIVGGSGAGKTTLMKHIRCIGEQRFARTDKEREIRPVIVVKIPEPCTPIEVSYAVLEALGDRDPRGRKKKKDTHEAAEMFLRACEVRLVLIDNVQDIPSRRGPRGIELVSTRLRELIDSSYAVWVFLGTQAARKVINSDPQIVKRVGYRASLNYFSLETKADIKVFTRVLEKIDEHLPLAEPSCLVQPQNRSRLFLACDGIFDRLIKLVDRGWYLAYRNGREEMTLLDLEQAFPYVNGPCDAPNNPLSKEFLTRQLHGEGEPFEILGGAEIAHQAES